MAHLINFLSQNSVVVSIVLFICSIPFGLFSNYSPITRFDGMPDWTFWTASVLGCLSAINMIFFAVYNSVTNK